MKVEGLENLPSEPCIVVANHAQLQFVPMYIAPKLKTMYLGEPVTFDSEASIQEERERICRYLKKVITDMAVKLPEHTVIPYPNISPKLYPSNISAEVTKS